MRHLQTCSIREYYYRVLWFQRYQTGHISHFKVDHQDLPLVAMLFYMSERLDAAFFEVGIKCDSDSTKLIFEICQIP